MSRIENLIYDLDGTLADSAEFFMKSYRSAVEGYIGIEVFESKLPELLGTNEFGVLKAILGEHWQRGAEAFNESEDAHLRYASAFPGVIRMLCDFKSDGIRQFVVTGKSERNASKLIGALAIDEYVAEVRFGQADRSSKEQNIQAIIKKHGLTHSKTAYLGDTKSDYEAAVACMITPLICAWGARVKPLDYSFPPEVKKFDSVNSFRDFVMTGTGKTEGGKIEN
jgi:phosphoglycolate phosphatase-like HAD superfamily hydrolase